MEGLPLSQPPEGVDRLLSSHFPGQQQKRREKPSRRLENFSPEFWDTLEKMFLTPRYLREFDRRNHTHQVPAFAVPELHTRDVFRFARHGGPDLGHLRGCADRSQMGSYRSSLPSDKQVQTDQSPKEKCLSVYDRNFMQHLAQNGVYMDNKRAKLADLSTDKAKLAEKRPSFDAEAYKHTFEQFEVKNDNVTSEAQVMSEVVPLLVGKTTFLNGQNVLFTRNQPFGNDRTVCPKPDFFDGAHLCDMTEEVKNNPAVKAAVIPTERPEMPVASNFFLEAKGPWGVQLLAQRQAAFDGAYGTRAMHTLQNLNKGEGEPVYNGQVSAFSAIYEPTIPSLGLNAHHITAPRTDGGKPEYHVNKVGTWCVYDVDSFISAITVLRNARDMAAQIRDGHIRDANMRPIAHLRDGGINEAAKSGKS